MLDRIVTSCTRTAASTATQLTSVFGAFVIHEYRADVISRTLHTDVCHSSESSASYTPEFLAFCSGYKWFASNLPDDSLPLLHFTDSQSALSELSVGPLCSQRVAAFGLWHSIIAICRTRRVSAAFLFSHVAPEGVFTANDLVDGLAKGASGASRLAWLAQERLTVWFRDATRTRMEWLRHRERARMSARLAPLEHQPLRCRFGDGFEPVEAPALPRSDQILLAQIRCGVSQTGRVPWYSTPLAQHTCPLCNAPGFGRHGTAVLHVFVCDEMRGVRESMGGTLTFRSVFSADLTELGQVVAYVRAFGARCPATAVPLKSAAASPVTAVDASVASVAA